MSKVRLFVFILIIAGLVFGGLWYLDRSLSQSPSIVTSDISVYQADGITWYQDRSKTFSLAVFKGAYEVVFDAEPPALKETATAQHFVAAANAGYFKGTILQSQHVGLLAVDGEVLEPLVNDSQKQLTQIAILNKENGVVNFVTTRNFDVSTVTRPQFIAFQSGPLILKDSIVQFSEISDSLNGSGRFARTVLGYTNTGENFLMISRTSITLDDLANKILKLDVFAGKKVSALNLDGGSSTAIYSSSFVEVNFGETKRLPAIIGVKAK